MMRYKQKPPVVEAVQFTGYNQQEVKEFCEHVSDDGQGNLTLNGTAVNTYDFVVKDKEAFAVWTAGDFVGTYELTE